MTRQPRSYVLTLAAGLFASAAFLRADTPLPTSKPAAAATQPATTQAAAAPDPRIEAAILPQHVFPVRQSADIGFTMQECLIKGIHSIG